MTFAGTLTTADGTRISLPTTSGAALTRLFMTRTTIGCVLYFFAIDATDSPAQT